MTSGSFKVMVMIHWFFFPDLELKSCICYPKFCLEGRSCFKRQNQFRKILHAASPPKKWPKISKLTFILLLLFITFILKTGGWTQGLHTELYSQPFKKNFFWGRFLLNFPDWVWTCAHLALGSHSAEISGMRSHTQLIWLLLYAMPRIGRKCLLAVWGRAS